MRGDGGWDHRHGEHPVHGEHRRGRAAWLEDLIVHPEWRAIGVGDRLLREAIHGAKLAGCKRLTLLTDESNTVAMRGYARAGFVRSRMVPMRLMLCRSR